MARVPWLEPGNDHEGAGRRRHGHHLPHGQHPRRTRKRWSPTCATHRSASAASARHGLPSPCRATASTANAEVLAMAMIETADGVRNLEAICATPGLDGVYVGPADLALGTQEGRLAARARPGGGGDDRHHPPHRRRLPRERHQGRHPLRHAGVCAPRHRVGLRLDLGRSRLPPARRRRSRLRRIVANPDRPRPTTPKPSPRASTDANARQQKPPLQVGVIGDRIHRQGPRLRLCHGAESPGPAAGAGHAHGRRNHGGARGRPRPTRWVSRSGPPTGGP